LLFILAAGRAVIPWHNMAAMLYRLLAELSYNCTMAVLLY